MQITTTSEFVAITSDLEGQGWVVPAGYLAVMDTDDDAGVDNFPGAVEFSWVEDETRDAFAAGLAAAGFVLGEQVAQGVDEVTRGAQMSNTLHIQQLHTEPVNGSDGPSWQDTVYTSGTTDAVCPDMDDFDLPDETEGTFRMQITDASGVVLDTSESMTL